MPSNLTFKVDWTKRLKKKTLFLITISEIHDLPVSKWLEWIYGWMLMSFYVLSGPGLEHVFPHKRLQVQIQSSEHVFPHKRLQVQIQAGGICIAPQTSALKSLCRRVSLSHNQRLDYYNYN